MSKVRYAWDTPEKSKTLIALLKDAIAKKDSAERRWVTSNDWDAVFEAYNAKLPAQPAPNVLALKNRLALMKMQYKEYHKVITARKGAGGSLGPEAWQLLIQKHPDVQKWRGVEFPFYDELQDLFRLLGVDDSDLEIKHRKPRASTGAKPQDVARSPYAGAGAATSSSVSPSATLRHSQLPQNGGVVDPSIGAAVLSGAHPAVLRKRDGDFLPDREAAAQRPRRTTPILPMAAPDEYEIALGKLSALNLSTTERVDAKLFLVCERHARAFVHMDMDEQRDFLFKYCFKPRDQFGRCHLEW